jgi:CBS-domain-containing membrane protein
MNCKFKKMDVLFCTIFFYIRITNTCFDFESITLTVLRVKILDKKFRQNINRYIFQCSLATFTILLILLFLDVLEETAILASLGATAFIVFTMPNAYSSHPRRLVGGYCVGVVVGLLCYMLVSSSFFSSLPVSQTVSVAVFGAIAVGIAIFVMVATDTEHAPAAGIALGLILNDWDFTTVIFIVTAVMLMAFVRRMLKPILLDLI